MVILGGIDDQISSIIWTNINNGLFLIQNPQLLNYPPYALIFEKFTNPLSSNQPLFWLFTSVFLSTFKSVNALIVFTLTLNIFFGYLLFKQFKEYKWLFLIFVFSAYTWLHFGIHLVLMQIWLYALFLYLLLNKKQRPIILGIVLAIIILISNYIGFFLLLFFTIYTILQFFCYKNTKQIINYFKSVIVGLGISFVFLLSYFRQIYTTAPTNLIVSSVMRPFEDFVYFTGRPWYFFMPPEGNPFVGFITPKINTFLLNTNYFLADDYFAKEHGASFFGFCLILTSVVVAILLLKHRKISSTNKNQAFIFFMTSIFIVCLMMPPFITISGIKIILPSMFIFKVFPMFRVLIRLSVLVQLCLLLYIAYAFEFFKEIKLKFSSYLKYFVVFLVFITLIETVDMPKITQVTNPPTPYTYLGQNNKYTNLVVYPYTLNEEALFWLGTHNTHIINMKYLMVDSQSSEDFTNDLNTVKGLQNAISKNVDYLLLSPYTDKQDIKYFESVPYLIQEKHFEDGYYLFKFNYDKSN